MKREEVLYEIGLSYQELVGYLINKYGPAKYNFFATPECKSKVKKVTRTSEGLICHHAREDVGGNLSDVKDALIQPYEWQLKENLVYCNLLEHLLLHIKIAVLRQKSRLMEPYEIRKFFTTDGIFQITSVINDVYTNEGSELAWLQRCYDEINTNYNEYLLLLSLIIGYIVDQYEGDKAEEEYFLKKGSFVIFSDGKYEIVGASKTRESIIISTNSGDKAISWLFIKDQLKYMDYLEMVSRMMCKGYDTFCDDIFYDFIEYDDPIICDLYDKLRIDFNGYGFPQFNDKKLDKGVYGSESVDEYLSKAFPTYASKDNHIGDAAPIFWKGDIPDDVVNSNCYYIVRVSTCFKIKNGQEPFARYKGSSLKYPIPEINRDTSRENNLIKKSGIVFSTSFVYSPEDKQYHEFYRDLDGEVKQAVVEITFDKYDFELFKKRYDIKSLEIVDGCYFK